MIDNCFQLVLPKSHREKVIGILANGAETHGMNSVIRSSVLLGNYIGSKVYIIRNGFNGLIEDVDDNIIAANWKTVAYINYYGGCLFGSGASGALDSREKRLEITYNLLLKKITYLVVISGTNTMKLSELLRNEWKELLDELVETKRITKNERKNKNILHIVYLPGPNNNFYGSDILTVGRDSALHSIMKAIDDITNTAHSDNHIYIMEILGEKCGYLALVAGIYCEADYIFIPEYPAKDDWHYKLCDQITMQPSKGYIIIIMTEGTVDFNGTKITPNDVKDIIFRKIHRVAFIKVVGDVQLIGYPSAFDRILGSRLGVAAVLFLVNSPSDTASSVITILDNNKTISIPVMELLKTSETLAEAYAYKNWELALRLNGQTFESKLKRYLLMTTMKPTKNIRSENYQIGVMCIGTASVGMNAVISRFVKYCLYRGHTVFGIMDGIEGLISGNVKKMDWSDVSRLNSKNGVILGSDTTLPTHNFQEIAYGLKEFNIQGLLFIGGFDAYYSCLLLAQQRSLYPEFRIPLVVIPATISNNVPGTEITIGSDTCLNQITTLCSQMFHEADLLNRLYILEIMGGHCGYLTAMSSLAVGADAAYIYEDTFKVEDLNKDVSYFKAKVSQSTEKIFVLNNEKSSTNYDSEFLRRLFTEESKDSFKVSVTVLSYMDQGWLHGSSPFDRNMGTKMAAMSVDWLITEIKNNINCPNLIKCNNPNTACVLGLFGRDYRFTPVTKLMKQTNIQDRIPNKQWWVNLGPLIKLLGNRGTLFSNGILIDKNCSVCEENFLR